MVIEKPLRHDLQSAIELNDQIHQVLDEDQIYRIDHFLGKEPVQDITYLRFANRIRADLEPPLRRVGPDHDGGGLRSRRPRQLLRLSAPCATSSHHILQTLALVAMEPPSAGEHRCDPRREARPFRRSSTQTETPCARPVRGLREIEGWIQTPPRDVRGPPAGHSELALVRGPILHPRRQAAGGEGHRGARGPPEPSANRDRRGPDPEDGRDRPPHRSRPRGLLLLEAKQPGQEALRRVHPTCSSRSSSATSPGPMRASRRRARRQPAALRPRGHGAADVEDHAATARQPLTNYRRGTWGPEGASNLLHGYGGWRRPWLPDDAEARRGKAEAQPA